LDSLIENLLLNLHLLSEFHNDQGSKKSIQTEEIKEINKNEETKPAEIKNEDLKNEEIKSAEIKNEDLKNEEIKSAEIKNEDLKNEEIKSAEIKNEDLKNEEAKKSEIKKQENNEQKSEEIIEIHQNGILCMLTALLLNYEQIYKNNFNINKLPAEQMSRKHKEGSCTAFLSEKIREIIMLGLKPANSTEILLTTLQIVYLLIEQKEIIEKEDLLICTNAIINSILTSISASENIEKIFEQLSLFTLCRILDRIPILKGKDEILSSIAENANLLEKMKLMHAFKPHLKQATEYVIYKLCLYPTYHKLLQSMKYEVFLLYF